MNMLYIFRQILIPSLYDDIMWFILFNQWFFPSPVRVLPNYDYDDIVYPPAVLNSFDVMVESIFPEHGNLPCRFLTIQPFLSVSTLKELIGALYDKTFLGSSGGIWYLNAL
jgi:hypothetical protein